MGVWVWTAAILALMSYCPTLDSLFCCTMLGGSAFVRSSQSLRAVLNALECIKQSSNPSTTLPVWHQVCDKVGSVSLSASAQLGEVPAEYVVVPMIPIFPLSCHGLDSRTPTGRSDRDVLKDSNDALFMGPPELQASSCLAGIPSPLGIKLSPLSARPY